MTTGYYTAVKLGPDNRPSSGTVLRTGTKAECAELWKPGEIVICWNYDAPPPRKLSPEALGRVRRKRLRARLERKHPLFADQLYRQETNANPRRFYPDLFFSCAEDAR